MGVIGLMTSARRRVAFFAIGFFFAIDFFFTDFFFAMDFRAAVLFTTFFAGALFLAADFLVIDFFLLTGFFLRADFFLAMGKVYQIFLSLRSNRQRLVFEMTFPCARCSAARRVKGLATYLLLCTGKRKLTCCFPRSPPAA
jgi:hypothetical protein